MCRWASPPPSIVAFHSFSTSFVHGKSRVMHSTTRRDAASLVIRAKKCIFAVFNDASASWVALFPHQTTLVYFISRWNVSTIINHKFILSVLFTRFPFTNYKYNVNIVEIILRVIINRLFFYLFIFREHDFVNFTFEMPLFYILDDLLIYYEIENVSWKR